MRTELSFLMDLFLSDEVPKPIKAMVADRIREVEETMVARPSAFVPTVFTGAAHPTTSGTMAVQQAPSMQRIMERHPEVLMTTAATMAPQPATPAAAQALAARAALLNTAASEKPEPGRTSKRKF